MKKSKKQKYEIVTMSKAKFDKLPKWKKRCVVAQDVIDRIELKQLIPKTGALISGSKIDELCKQKIIRPSDSVGKVLQIPKATCSACAKGSLFLSFLGIKHSRLNIKVAGYLSSKNDDIAMKELRSIFDSKQLSIMETIFEGVEFYWNDELTDDEEVSCIKYRDLYRPTTFEPVDYRKLLIDMCKNIIANKGTFKLPKNL